MKHGMFAKNTILLLVVFVIVVRSFEAYHSKDGDFG